MCICKEVIGLSRENSEGKRRVQEVFHNVIITDNFIKKMTINQRLVSDLNSTTVVLYCIF